MTHKDNSFKRLQDDLYESPSLKKSSGQKWLQDTTYIQTFWNSIASVTLPNMAKVGQDAITASHGQIQSPCGIEWTFLYSAIDIIINQTTPLHISLKDLPSVFVSLRVSSMALGIGCLQPCSEKLWKYNVLILMVSKALLPHYRITPFPEYSS
ncbi:hypothetical protein ID866_12722 [Astraeus odoratus]|nr:hypothetical protein ID866_12722 [Astraeus odoratus]